MRGSTSIGIEQNAARIPDAVEKLRYLRRAGKQSNVRSAWLRAFSVAVAVPALLSFSPARPMPRPGKPAKAVSGPSAGAKVWLVEQSPLYTLYSNGLHVRNDFVTTGEPRRYRSYARDGFRPSPLRSEIAGIVFHTTESLILPFDARENESLKRSRVSLLEHVRRDRLYNFVIDRFGEVFRVVPENQTANHAGHSVWADGRQVWLDLNQSFLGVSFEAETDASFRATEAQVHAGRMLVQMLRAAYSLDDPNCVTHAQVSVNPDNMRLGYHTDWAALFPFREIGLNAGYSAPIAGVALFGFAYDGTFLNAIGDHPWDGLTTAEVQLVRDAAALGMTPAAHRSSIQQHYQLLRRHHYDPS